MPCRRRVAPFGAAREGRPVLIAARLRLGKPNELKFISADRRGPRRRACTCRGETSAFALRGYGVTSRLGKPNTP